MRWPTSIAVMVALAVLPGAPAQAGQADRTLGGLVNAERSERGLLALRGSPALTRSAGRYARTLLRRGVLAHGTRIAAPRRFLLLGENLALVRGRSAAPRHAVQLWMRSPTHRNVMLHPDMRRIGVGRAVGSFRGRAAIVWVLHVGRISPA